MFKDFKPPDALFTRDSVELRKLGSLVVLITAIQAVKHSSRFNELEARTVFVDDPDFERIVIDIEKDYRGS